MPIYEVTSQQLTAISSTSFAVLELKERSDLQRLLAARIDALEDGLLVLAEEFADWADSARRIDLLCLDREARLVVVELKRDEEGGHMELQALRYAAMVSAMTFEQAIGTLARRRSIELDAAREAILAHLGWAGPGRTRARSRRRRGSSWPPPISAKRLLPPCCGYARATHSTYAVSGFAHIGRWMGACYSISKR